MPMTNHPLNQNLLIAIYVVFGIVFVAATIMHWLTRADDGEIRSVQGDPVSQLTDKGGLVAPDDQDRKAVTDEGPA